MDLPDIAFARQVKLQKSAKSVDPKSPPAYRKTDPLSSDKVLSAAPESGLIPESMAARPKGIVSAIDRVKSSVRGFRLKRYEKQSAKAQAKLAEQEGPRNQQFLKMASRGAQTLNNPEARRAALTLGQKLVGRPEDDLIQQDLKTQNQRIDKVTSALGPFHQRVARNVLDGYVKQEESAVQSYTKPNMKTYLRAAKQSAGMSKEGTKFITLDNSTVKAQQTLSRSEAKIQELRTGSNTSEIHTQDKIGSIVDDPLGALNDTSYLAKGEEDHSLKKSGIFGKSLASQQAARRQQADQLASKFRAQHDEAHKALIVRNQQQQTMAIEGIHAGIEGTYAKLKTLKLDDVKKVASNGLTMDDLQNAAVDMSKHVGNCNASKHCDEYDRC